MNKKLQIVYSDNFNFSINKKFKRLFDYEVDKRKQIKHLFENGNISEAEFIEQTKQEEIKLNKNRLEVNSKIFNYFNELEITENDFINSQAALSKFGLERPINIEGIINLVENVQNKETVAKFAGKNLNKNENLDPYYIDLYFGIHLHNILRLTRAEASRSEFWNSLSMNQSIKEYLNFRNTYSEARIVDKLKANSFFIYGQTDLVVENHLARPWWATELSRNGASYETSIDAFKQTQMYTMRWNLMTLIHNKLFSLSVINFLTNQKFKIGRRDTLEYLGRVMNDYAASKRFSLDFENYVKENEDKFSEWQSEEFNPKKLEGPNDCYFSESIIKEKVKLLKNITKDAVDPKGRKFL